VALDRQGLEAKLKSCDSERKHIKSKMVKAERQTQRLLAEIEGLKQKIVNAENELVVKDEELKSNHERKVKAWTGRLTVLRVLYPLKAEMDRILDEKSKIKAELDEAVKVQKIAESDLNSSEKYVGECRNKLSGLEEEYVGLQTKIHAVEKQNAEARINKESLKRQLKDEEEQIPLIEAEANTYSAKVSETKKQLADLDNNKKQHQKNIRGIEGNINRTQKKLGAVLEQIKQTEGNISAVTQRNEMLSNRIADRNTGIIRALDEKQAMEKQLTEHRKQQSVLESEIKIIAGIYDMKA
jgi:chromosome segregation ATPase